MEQKLEQLQKVLGKNPVIQTHSAEDLIANPKMVEQNYTYHASTHMSLGDAKEYEKRIFKNLKDGKAFAGLTTGDFGLGKTSYLVNLWMQLSAKNVMAIPPFSWRKLDDIFKTISAWVEYRLEKENKSALEEFRLITNEYRQKSFEEEVKSMIAEHGVTEKVAISILTRNIDKGTFILNRNISELLQFLDEASEFLKTVGYEGLVVCLDEFQVTVSELSPDRAFQYLFELSNYTLERTGSYGLMVGLPLNTFVQMRQVKADALDRFASQHLIVDLARIYNEEFAEVLWKRYVEYFDFADIAGDILDPYALKGLGEITDSTRKDIGNGPRSVISGFNAIIEHFIENRTQYTLLHLIGDILEKKVLLGERSNYITKVSSLLKKVGGQDVYFPFIYVLAGLPQGCKQEVLDYYEVMNAESESLLKEWLGVEIFKSTISGYRLAVLSETAINPESFYERAVRNFNMSYTAKEEKWQQNALKAFNELVIPKLLTEKERLNWTCVFEQETDDPIEFKKYKEAYYTEIGGTFDRTKNSYPNRHLMLVTHLSTQKATKPSTIELTNKYRFVGTWYFKLELEQEAENELVQSKDNEFAYQFKLNLRQKLNEQLPIVSDNVEDASLDAMFILNFIYYLKNSTDIPQSDQTEIDYNIEAMLDVVVALLFTEKLKTIKNNSHLTLMNHGQRLLPELFESMCKRKYPDYYTLMAGAQMSRYLKNYKIFLENENVSMEVKRGYKPVVQRYETLTATEKRNKVTERFTIQSTATFEKLVLELSNIIGFNNSGDLYLKIHPSEQFCVDKLKESAKEIKVEGKMCQALYVDELSEMLRELGYVSEEISYFFGLGALRKIFQYDPSRSVLYFKPLTLEEWKVELTQAFDYIQQLEDELRLYKVNVSVDLASVEEEIVSIEDENSYERLAAKLKQLEETCLKAMNVHIHQELNVMTDRFNKTSKELLDITRNFEDVKPDESEEKKLWFEKQSTLQEELKQCQAFYQEVYQIRSETPKIAPHDFVKAANGIEKFADFIERIATMDKQLNSLKENRKALKEKQAQWLRWEDYFNARHELRHLINVLKTTGLSQMMGQIEVIDEEVQAQFKNDDFSNSEFFIRRLKQMREEIHAELKKSRDKFEQQKEQYQMFLNESQLRRTLNTQFSEQNQFSSYESLDAEMQKIVTEQIEKWLAETEVLEQRLIYLNQIMEKDVTDVEEQVHVITADLFKLQALTSDAIEIEKLALFKEMVKRMTAARSNVQTVVQKESLVEKEELLMESMTSSSLTLEELILNYEQNTDKLDLEEVLALMSSLFKKNHINIRIEKGGNK